MKTLFRNSKKTLSFLILLLFIILCVMISIVFKTLENDLGWKKDLSFNEYATTGAETEKVLKSMENPVEIYLLYQNGSPDKQMLQLLERYDQISNKIKVIQADINLNPGLLVRFPGTQGHAPAADDIIVSCPSTFRYEIFSYDDFIQTGYNTESGKFEFTGLAYEKKLTESIMFVSQNDVPVIGMLSGHGELDENSMTVFSDFLKSNHYSVCTVNLLKGDSLAGIDLLLIGSPQKDIADSELAAILTYTQSGGSLLILRDYTDPVESMPGYQLLLKQYGAFPLPGIVVASEEDNGSYYGEPLALLPYMQETDFTSELISSGLDVLLMPAACAFDITGETEIGLTVQPILFSGKHSYIRNFSDENESIEFQPSDLVGSFVLSLYSERTHSNGNISRCYICGNSPMFINDYIYQRTFNEEFLIQLLGKLIPRKAVSLDIMASAALRPALRADCTVPALLLSALIPLLIFGSALSILLPRKHRQ